MLWAAARMPASTAPASTEGSWSGVAEQHQAGAAGAGFDQLAVAR